MDKTFLEYVRHLSSQDTKTLSQKALKTCEEVGELARVVLPYDNAYATTHRFVERESILEESADVILTALSVMYDLKFTDDEIDDMLFRKAEKWARLQTKEENVKYPLPYEIHVTVSLKHTFADMRVAPEDQIAGFRSICETIGVKPIILDLQNKGASVMVDVMTSSKHFGTNRSALAEATRISDALRNSSWHVVRTKIETVPWHPAAPMFDTDVMPPNCYFESHIPIILVEEHVDLLREHHNLGMQRLHISRNTYKRNLDGTVVVMATYRDTQTTREQFEANVAHIREDLIADGYTLGKSIIEFSVYDTKVSHDASWIAS